MREKNDLLQCEDTEIVRLQNRKYAYAYNNRFDSNLLITKAIYTNKSISKDGIRVMNR